MMIMEVKERMSEKEKSDKDKWKNKIKVHDKEERKGLEEKEVIKMGEKKMIRKRDKQTKWERKEGKLIKKIQ